MKQRQLRTWFIASAAAVLALGLGISQLDSNKIYHQLQSSLAASGIQLQADNLSLSLMYTGSIRLDNVHIQSDTFEADAQRLFIDLNLAALLTGEAVPQAIYLQFSDINIIQNEQSDWLTLLQNDSFKLKRINITRSEIHFEQQHLTLESVDLDIRDIGKNRNPRMELQAHIGDGRIDAHGYLRLKRGEIHKGFGRVKVIDVPLNHWKHDTTLGTLSGSITSHLNPDSSWQSFGHISLQKEHKNTLELRVKIIGNHQQKFLSIQDLVLNHKDMGALQISGDCTTIHACKFSMLSKAIKLEPLAALLQTQSIAKGKMKEIQIRTELNNGHWMSYAKANWEDIEYIQYVDNETTRRLDILPTTLQISDFQWTNNNSWSINKVSLTSSNHAVADISIDKVSFHNNALSLPFTLTKAKQWLPITQWLWPKESIAGKGTVDGTIKLTLQHNQLTSADISLDASQVAISSLPFSKPKNIPFNLAGKLLWEEEKLPAFAELGMTLGESTFKLRQEDKHWHFNNLDVDFDQLKEDGIQLPEFWKPWYGYIRGNTTLHIPHETIVIEEANIDLIQFGKDRHYVDGQIIIDGTLWDVENLHWTHEKNEAEFFGGKNNQFDIVAESLDVQALALLQSLPFLPHGKLKTKALRLPFGTLSDVSANYQSMDESLALKTFKSKFYEGTLHAEQVDVFTQDENIAMRGTIQVGGIHLNNWLWLHKQFNTHLQATVYATLNLHGEFDEKQRLASWKGDGDVSIYNGVWLFNNKNLKADKLNVKLRKRKEFNATFNVKDGKYKGSGTLRIDEEKQVSGQLKWLDKTYIFAKTWPKFRFKEEVANTKAP